MTQETLCVRTPQNVQISMELAGVGYRAIAALIDYSLLTIYVMVVVIVGLAMETVALTVVLALPGVLYFLLGEIFLDGRSIGKRQMSLTVVRVDGSEPRIGDYLLRWAFRLVDLWLATGLVAVVSVLVTEKGQRLGDLVAGTTVVRVGEGARLAQIVLDDRQAEYRPTFQEAQFLQQEEVQTAREVLQVLRRNGPGSRAEGLGEKAKATFERKMEVSSEMEPEAFLETVLRDYNHLNGRL